MQLPQSVPPLGDTRRRHPTARQGRSLQIYLMFTQRIANPYLYHGITESFVCHFLFLFFYFKLILLMYSIVHTAHFFAGMKGDTWLAKSDHKKFIIFMYYFDLVFSTVSVSIFSCHQQPKLNRVAEPVSFFFKYH